MHAILCYVPFTRPSPFPSRYVGLLSGQLESQRVYFAEMMAQTERAAKERHEYIEQQCRYS